MADTTFVSKVTVIATAWLQAINDWIYRGGRPTFDTTTGAANVFTLDLGTSSLKTSVSEGDTFAFAAHQSNSGAATFGLTANAVSVGSAAIQLNGAALTGNEIRSGGVYVVTRVGAVWQLNGMLQSPLPITLGGTGSTTAVAAFNALSPLTTKGDVLANDGTNDVRKAVGTDGYALQALSGASDGLAYLPQPLGISLLNGYLDWTVSANALTAAIKTIAGTDPSATDPVYLWFRDATATDGAPNLAKIVAATSATLSSGSTIGAASGTAFRLWAVLFDDGGTYRLGLINCLSGTAPNFSIYPLGAWPIGSSTAEGGAGGADSAATFYTGAAVTSKPYVVLGYATWESGLSVAGTWDAAPTRKHLLDANTPLPGRVIQIVREQTGAVATGTITLPEDDTIPQNTEGNEFIDAVITPRSAANILEVETQLALANSATTNNHMEVALFQDSVADAKAVMFNTRDPTANGLTVVGLSHSQLAGSSGAITMNVRAGQNFAGTTTFNGNVGRLYGGRLSSFINIAEIMA